MSALHNVQPKDLVRLDNDPTDYTVQAASQAGQDIYVTEGPNTSIGSWVDVRSVTHINGEQVTR